ncbi:MAG: hypothetical protein DRP08_02435 [Candidatus Aenigmatarchaeota archaeon]|nr:cytidylate kinase family protein [Candidatus Aenigmarchaeota archaeon]RLJ04109.1 MAG: hypothetical protein DRP08_02435 [Candidatus Aenigmarchaeota archaeon]
MTTVIISGKSGAGSSTIGQLLAKKLGLDYFSLGKWYKQQFKMKSENEETDAAIKGWKSKEGSSKELHNKLDNIQLTLAKKGHIVIDSKLGIHFLKGLADFTVWLEASLPIRAARYAKRSKTDIDTAIKQLEEKESAERKSWKKIYGFDYFDQRNQADLVVDTSDKTPEEIVDHIIRVGRMRGLIG